MHRAIRWIGFAILALLILNVIAYPASYLMPNAGTPYPKPGIPIQNFTMVLFIEFIIVMLFADVFYFKNIKRPKHFPSTSRDVKENLIGTIIEFDYPLFVTALFLIIQIILMYRLAF